MNLSVVLHLKSGDGIEKVRAALLPLGFLLVKGLSLSPILPSLSLSLSMVVFNSVFVQMAGCPISIHYRFLEHLIMEQERRAADGNIEESLSLFPCHFIAPLGPCMAQKRSMKMFFRMPKYHILDVHGELYRVDMKYENIICVTLGANYDLLLILCNAVDTALSERFL